MTHLRRLNIFAINAPIPWGNISSGANFPKISRKALAGGGMLCQDCHTPYGNEGYYEGGDVSISKEKPGHLLVHSIQASRKATVNGDVRW